MDLKTENYKSKILLSQPMISFQHILYIANDWKNLRSQERSGINEDC